MIIEHLDASHIDWKVPIERSVLINTDIDNATLRLYLILLSYARDKVTAFPSRETLATDMGCSVRNIDLLKNKLKKHDLLSWETHFNGMNKHNIYTLLQYKPIKKGVPNRQKIAGKTGKKLPTNNKQPKNIIIKNDKIKKVADEFKSSYERFCKSSSDKALSAKDLIQTEWHKYPNYKISQGDVRNLQEFFENNGESGLNKLRISFKFLDKYLEDNIGYSEFHTSDGKELVPTISLFIKAKMQYDNITSYVRDELEYILENPDSLEDLSEHYELSG